MGATGLALLALARRGDSHRIGSHRREVREGLRWLRGRQQPDGGFDLDPRDRGAIVGHALASLALVELLGVSGDRSLRAPCEVATARSERLLDPTDPASGGVDDATATWLVFALVSARRAGLALDAATEERLAAWAGWPVDGSWARGPLDLGPLGAAARLALGAGAPPHLRTVDAWGVLDALDAQRAPRALDRWWTAMALGAVRGPAAREGLPRIGRALLGRRVAGCALGSFDPMAGEDRLVATALAALTLGEVEEHGRGSRPVEER